MWIKSNYLIKDVFILHRFLTYVNSIFQIYIFFRNYYRKLFFSHCFHYNKYKYMYQEVL